MMMPLDLVRIYLSYREMDENCKSTNDLRQLMPTLFDTSEPGVVK